MTTLYAASNQWAARPLDERFWTVQDLLAATLADRRNLRESTTPAHALTAAWDDERPGELFVVGKSGQPAALSFGGMDKLCRLVEAPASYLRTLPAEIAAKNLAVGLARRGGQEVKLLLHQNGDTIQLRDASSEVYQRIFGAEIAARLVSLAEQGWRVPPARPAGDDPRARPATEDDVLACCRSGIPVRVGDMIAPAGLCYGYSATSTLFAFMVDDTRPIDAGSGRQLFRGFFVDSPELSGVSLKLTWFLFDGVCGNHYVWGVDQVVTVKVRHVGSAADRAWAELELVAENFSSQSGEDTEAKIRQARGHILGKDKAEVLDKLFGLRIATRKVLERGFALAELSAGSYGDPKSCWGMVSGLTEAAQEESWVEARVAIDQAAGKVLEMAF